MSHIIESCHIWMRHVTYTVCVFFNVCPQLLHVNESCEIHAQATCNTYATHCNILQHTATHCNTLQYTATHCNTLEHTAMRCNTLQMHAQATCVSAHACMYACAYYSHATHCNDCNALPRTATHCNALQRTATHCNTLQHTATGAIIHMNIMQRAGFT